MISLYANRLGATNMYGFGIESSGGVMYNKAVTGHNWYIGVNADNGVSAKMRLSSSILFIKTNVGIGTSNPVGNLEIANSSGAVLSISTNGSNGSATSPLKPTLDFLGYSDGNKARITATERTYNTHGSELSFLVNDGSSATGLVERLTIIQNGNVGIGTTSPNKKLHIYTGSSGATPFSSATSVIESNSTGLMQILTNNTGVGGIMFGDPEHSYSGYIRYAHSDNSMKLYTASTVRLTINGNGNIGIGTSETGTHKLVVDGTIGAREIVVETGDWSDFVFNNDYELKDLEEVESFIEENNHLPDVPAEKEVLENGIKLGEMDATLLQKIEELTLYMIEMNKRMNSLESENSELIKKIELMETAE